MSPTIHSYLRAVDVIILVFDLNSSATLRSIKEFWFKEARKVVSPTTKFLLIGNKLDENHPRDKDLGDEWSEEMGIDFVKTSAWRGDGIELALKFIGKYAIVDKFPFNENGEIIPDLFIDELRIVYPFDNPQSEEQIKKYPNFWPYLCGMCRRKLRKKSGKWYTQVHTPP